MQIQEHHQSMLLHVLVYASQYSMGIGTHFHHRSARKMQLQSSASTQDSVLCPIHIIPVRPSLLGMNARLSSGKVQIKVLRILHQVSDSEVGKNKSRSCVSLGGRGMWKFLKTCHAIL